MIQETRTPLRGVIPAILTPMDASGRVDYTLLERQARYLSAAGVDGFFVGGTTAEGAYLSTEEKRAIYDVVRSVGGDDRFVCLACIRPSTREVIDEMLVLADLQPDYVVAVTPYYLSMRPGDIAAHYREIADAAPAPLILYDIPGNTHNRIAYETLMELALDTRIAGCKDSSGDFSRFCRGLLNSPRDDFRWIQGDDLLDGPALMMGCHGIVTGMGNARIEPYVDLFGAATRGDVEGVRKGQRRVNLLNSIISLCSNPIAAAKAVTEIEGRGSRWLRQSSLSASEELFPAIRGILAELDNGTG